MAVLVTLSLCFGCVAAVLLALGLPGGGSLASAVVFLLPVLAWGWRLAKIRRTGVIRPFPLGQWLLRVCLSRLLPFRLAWRLLWRLTPVEAHHHLEALFERSEFDRKEDPVHFRRAYVQEWKAFAILSLVLVGGSFGGVVDTAESLGIVPPGTSPYGRKPAIGAELTPGPPPARADADVEPFTAVHFKPGKRWLRAEGLAQFTLAGLRSDTARPADRNVRHVARDPGADRHFGITAHDFGVMSAATGAFEEIAPDPALDFSWPTGIARDPISGRVLVLTSHVFTRLYRFDPQTGGWERLAGELRDVPLIGLAWWPAHESFYALEYRQRDRSAPRIHRFDREGAHVGSMALDPPISAAGSSLPSEGIQLLASSGGLVVMLPPDARQGPYLIDPENGRVAVYAQAPPASRAAASAPPRTAGGD